MDFPVPSFAPDPGAPRIVYRAIRTTSRSFQGTFLILVEPDLVLVAINVPSMQPGRCFGLDRRRNARTGRPIAMYREYASIYRMLRAYRSYIHGWAIARSEILADLSTLFRASLMATYGISILDPGQFEALQARLRPIIAEAEGEREFSSHRQAVRAIQMYRRTRMRDGSKRKVLGFMSAAANIEERRGHVEEVGEAVLSIGNILAHYIGGVIKMVRGVREGIEALLPLTRDDLYVAANAEVLHGFARTLDIILAARPFTHVRAYAPEECQEAATRIEQGARDGSDSRAFEELRELLAVTRNSLLLLEWQYDLEVVLTQVAEWVRAGYEPQADEWELLSGELDLLWSRLPVNFGRHFRNNVEPKMREGLRVICGIASCGVHPDPGADLVRVKNALVQISSMI